MRKILHLLILVIVVVSCSKDSEQLTTPEENIPEPVQGKHTFSVEFIEITPTNLANKSAKNLEPTSALISISDKDDQEVYTKEKIEILKVGEKYVTQEITLDEGSYSLTEFIVVDGGNLLIALVPKTDAVLSQFIQTSLPISFNVDKDEVKVTSTENLDAAGYTSVDFGYTEVSLEFPENSNFFSLTVDDSNLLTSKTLMLKSLTGSTYMVDWGDGVIDEYVSTIRNSGLENEISHTYTQNGVFTINVSGSVETIEVLDFNNDNQEDGFESHITSANIEKLTLLKSCQFYAGNLSTLNTSENVALETLGLGYNQISSIDLTNNPNLKTLRLRYNQLTALDIAQNTSLDFLSLEGNQIATMDLVNNIKLRVLLARENNLNSIDFTTNLELERFDLSDNFVTTIDVSANLGLTEINVGANQLTSIDLTQNTNLVRVDLYSNQIDAINLNANLKLRDLYINDNLLDEIDLSANTELERLIIENNNLNILDIAENPRIFNLEIGANQFSGPQLDQILTSVYDQAVLNTVMNGYIDYKNNPGFANIDPTTLSKLNELVADYNWSFNNN